MISKDSITTWHKIVNTSGKYLVVGNASDIISAHESAAAAGSAASTIDVDSSRWGVVKILAPGETWETELVAPRPMTTDEEAAASAGFAEWLKEQQS